MKLLSRTFFLFWLSWYNEKMIKSQCRRKELEYKFAKLINFLGWKEEFFSFYLFQPNSSKKSKHKWHLCNLLNLIIIKIFFNLIRPIYRLNWITLIQVTLLHFHNNCVNLNNFSLMNAAWKKIRSTNFLQAIHVNIDKLKP